MNLLRISISILAASVALSATASYDLLLVSDQLSNRVHRFDGSTGTYLGFFGNQTLSIPAGVIADAASGRAYVNSFGTNSIQEFDYSTGLLLNELKVGADPRGLTRIGNQLFVATGTKIEQWSTSGTFVRSFGSGLYISVGVGTDGFLYGYNYSTKKEERYSNSGVAAGTTTPAIDTGTYPRGGFASSGSTGYLTNDSANAINSFALGSSMTAGTSYNTASRILNPTCIAVGHGQNLCIGGRNAVDTTKYAFTTLSAATGFIGPVFGSGIVTNIGGMTSIVAPEPGSLVALGVGLLVIRSRRRR